MKFKELISAFLTTLCLASCSSIGSDKPDYMSEDVYNAGIQTIEIIDSLLDGDINCVTAYDKSKYYLDELKNADCDVDDAMDSAKLYSMTCDASILSLTLHKYEAGEESGISITSTRLEEIKEDRNKLAENFNIKAYEN